MSEHHDHSHAVVTEENSKKLMVALGLTTTFLIVEVVAQSYCRGLLGWRSQGRLCRYGRSF